MMVLKFEITSQGLYRVGYVDTDSFPCVLDDGDVKLIDALIAGVLGFIRGERDEEQMELMGEGEDAGA